MIVELNGVEDGEVTAVKAKLDESDVEDIDEGTWHNGLEEDRAMGVFAGTRPRKETVPCEEPPAVIELGVNEKLLNTAAFTTRLVLTGTATSLVMA